MRHYTSMTAKQLIKYTDGRKEPCPHCGCWSIRVPYDGSDPFCFQGDCPNAWIQDPELRTDRPKLTIVRDADED
jgi:hypothetical protein